MTTESTEPDRNPVLLIIDDETRILTAMQRSLRREGYEIHTAAMPEEALLIAKSRTLDIVLCDQRMPGMRGTELLAKIGEVHPHATRILMTGWTDAVTIGELESLGISGIFAKPWEGAELKKLLRKAAASVIASG